MKFISLLLYYPEFLLLKYEVVEGVEVGRKQREIMLYLESFEFTLPVTQLRKYNY
jgi:hypothetical protein